MHQIAGSGDVVFNPINDLLYIATKTNSEKGKDVIFVEEIQDKKSIISIYESNSSEYSMVKLNVNKNTEKVYGLKGKNLLIIDSKTIDIKKDQFPFCYLSCPIFVILQLTQYM